MTRASGWQVRRVVPQQCPVSVDDLSQKHYFCVSSCNNCSEFSDHLRAFNKLSVEGFKLICKTAAGSGVTQSLRMVGSGSTVCVDAQPVSASDVSTSNSVAHRLGRSEFNRNFLYRGGMRLLLNGLKAFGF